MSESSFEVCILAAGMGKRMKSVTPKALHPIAGRPMLEHLLSSIGELSAKRIHVVIGKGAEAVKHAFADHDINWVYQAEQRGTGHAVMQAMPDVSPSSRLLVLLGDAPLVTAKTMGRLLAADADLGVLTVDLPDPYNYGRIIRGDRDQVLGIVEERDATEEQRRIREINTGAMVASAAKLAGWLEMLGDDNDQGEYLLTDIVALANARGARVSAIKTVDPVEVLGVNTFAQLATLEREYQRRAAERLMEDGVRLADPARIDIRGRIEAGHDTSIDIDCVFEGDCVLGSNVAIGPHCVIRNSRVGDNVEIRASSVVDGAAIEAGCTVGPFARLRPGTLLRENVAVGNFVEVKQAELGPGTKASHLSYLGDAFIGAGVNIGAGTITCNYDGVEKHVTRISDHVFVGSNTALVAPVTIGEGSTIAAGSTITKNVDGGQLGIGRGKQRNIEGWKGPRDN